MRSFAKAEPGICLVGSLLLPCDLRSSLIWRVSRSTVALDVHPEFVICGTRYVDTRALSSSLKLIYAGIIMGFPTTLSMNLVSMTLWGMQ